MTSKEIRLAMLGMVDGNGHPYSWSAIFNGYDRDLMSRNPYPAISAYLDKQPSHNFGIAGAKVTHIWTDDPADAKLVAQASRVPCVVERATDVIGQVDAVIVATDRGEEHVARCRPFVEAGLPVFVDKPLCDNASDLQTFCDWVEGGAAIMSSSSMRYCKEFMPFRASTLDLGKLRFASITTPKSWERYGIHALESVYPILGPGFVSARNVGEAGRDLVHFRHQCGADVMVVARDDMSGSFGVLQLCGTAGHAHATASDTFWAFKAQLAAFVEFLQTGVRPFAWAQTVELMQMLIAGLRSREEGGREVLLSEIRKHHENALQPGAAKLRHGEVVSCFKMNLESPRAAEIVAMSGFDCVWTDREHSANDWAVIENQIRAAKCYNVDTLVRINRGGYGEYIKPLELDAAGIMVPHVMSLADAREVVQMTRFHPIGRRAVDGGNADGGFCNVDFHEYLQQANHERFIVLQIEDPEPLNELDAIAGLKGVDMLFFGPGDFSHAIGAPGDFSHPDLLAARQAVADACRDAGIWAGTVCSPANIDELVEMGYRFLSCGADVVGLNNYCREMLQSFPQPTLPLLNGSHPLKGLNGNSR